MTTYRVDVAVMGYCIVMTDDEGHQSVIESGIKSWESAKKKCERWERLEAKARAKAEKSA